MEIKLINSSLTKIQDSKIDLVLDELKTKFRNAEYIKSILVEISSTQKDVSILFNLMEEEVINENQIYLVEETGMMFFMTEHQYGIIDLKKIEIVEHKKAFTFGFPERVKKSIIQLTG